MAAASLLKDHPSNLDPTAVSVERHGVAAIYQTRSGYVVSLGWPYCLPGCYPTLDAAREALNGRR